MIDLFFVKQARNATHQVQQYFSLSYVLTVLKRDNSQTLIPNGNSLCATLVQLVMQHHVFFFCVRC